MLDAKYSSYMYDEVAHERKRPLGRLQADSIGTAVVAKMLLARSLWSSPANSKLPLDLNTPYKDLYQNSCFVIRQ